MHYVMHYVMHRRGAADAAAAQQTKGEQQIEELREACLQPYVITAATVCDLGCNRMQSRLQPYVTEAATVRT